MPQILQHPEQPVGRRKVMLGHDLGDQRPGGRQVHGADGGRGGGQDQDEHDRAARSHRRRDRRHQDQGEQRRDQ
jgi:hypothetical protein